MQNFFKKHKKVLLTGTGFWAILVLLLFFLFFQTTQKAKQTAINIIQKENFKNEEIKSWDSLEIRNLYKSILWMENQLALSKSDSISLGINLTDSLVQVQLKGAVLFQSQILDFFPTDFLNTVNSDTYFKLFGKPFSLQNEQASIAKKPIVKTKPGSQNDSIKTDKISPEIETPAFFWEFEVSNNIRMVVFGAELSTDSILIVDKKADLKSYFVKHSIPDEKEYIPTLFIWLDESKARATYRALPQNAKVVFRN